MQESDLQQLFGSKGGAASVDRADQLDFRTTSLTCPHHRNPGRRQAQAAPVQQLLLQGHARSLGKQPRPATRRRTLPQRSLQSQTR